MPSDFIVPKVVTREAYCDLLEQLETAEARANAAEAFIVRMDMAYRYEEFRLADPNPASGYDGLVEAPKAASDVCHNEAQSPASRSSDEG